MEARRKRVFLTGTTNLWENRVITVIQKGDYGGIPLMMKRDTGLLENIL